MTNAYGRVAYIATDQTITVILDGQSRTIQVKSIPHRNEVVLALEKFKKSAQSDRDMKILSDWLAPLKRAIVASDHRFELDEDGKRMYLRGTQVPLPAALAEKLVDFLEHQLPVDSLVKFWESCLKNPHYVAIDELFVFLNENHLPITEDGGFLGYKKLNFFKDQAHINISDDFEELTITDTGIVRSLTGKLVMPSVAKKYKEFVEATRPVLVDVHSGTIQQKVGEFVRIDRLKFNEFERRQECGYGLHIGAFSYSFSGHVRVLCKVMPEDVIACNEGQAKLRTCKYQIVSFVDSATEIKELMVNLNKEEQAIASGEDDDGQDFTGNDFEEGQTVKCIADSSNNNDITVGSFYYVIEADGEEILIVDDAGDQSWVEEECFELKD